MGDIVEVGTAWIGRELSWIEIMMLESFVVHGHNVTLFSESPESMPQIEGVMVSDMREVFPFTEKQRANMPAASFVDLFRIHMIAKTGLTWIDMDTISIDKIEKQDGYLLIHSDETSDRVSNGFLGLPNGSGALQQMLSEIENNDLDFSWVRPMIRRKIMTINKEDRIISASRLRRQVFGPDYVTSRLKLHSELIATRAKAVMDPVPWDLTDLFFDQKGGAYSWFTEETKAVHLALSQIRPRHIHKGAARDGSFLADVQKNINKIRGT